MVFEGQRDETSRGGSGVLRGSNFFLSISAPKSPCGPHRGPISLLLGVRVAPLLEVPWCCPSSLESRSQACAWDGEAGSRGGLAGRFSTTSSSRRQCWWWGRIWFISHSDSFYKFCQLSALSASILRLPEQTKTGATEALSGLQTARADRNWCHSGERRLAAGLARGGISNILPQ